MATSDEPEASLDDDLATLDDEINAIQPARRDRQLAFGYRGTMGRDDADDAEPDDSGGGTDGDRAVDERADAESEGEPDAPTTRRARKDRPHRAEYAAETSPRVAYNGAAARVVDVVRALGAVPLETIAKVARVVDNRPPQKSYKASLSLEASGVIVRRWVKRDLDDVRVPGASIIVTAGPMWDAWHAARDSLGLGGVARLEASDPSAPYPGPIDAARPRRATLDQVAMGVAVLGRIAAGWTLETGDAWLGPAVDLALARLPETGEGVALARARVSGRLRFEPGARVVGLLPPPNLEPEAGAASGTARATSGRRRKSRRRRVSRDVAATLPVLLLGGGWTSLRAFAAAIGMAAAAAPLAVVAPARGKRFEELVRKTVWDAVPSGRAYCPLVSVRVARARAWRDLVDALDAALTAPDVAVTRARIRAWLARSGAA